MSITKSELMKLKTAATSVVLPAKELKENMSP